MIHWTRKILNHIRHHSADRRTTIWTRLADWSLLASLVLAFPVTAWCNFNITRTEHAYGVVGMVQQDQEGDYTCYVSSRDAQVRHFSVPVDERFAYYQIDVEQMIRGLPLETSIRTRQPLIILRAPRTAREMTLVDTEAGSPVGDALRAGLDQSDIAEARQIGWLWEHGGGVRVEQNWIGWIAGSFLWWVTLFVAFSVAILFLRVASVVVLRNQAAQWDARSKQGHCVHCGYDLRGLEFSPRCPECGELQE